MTAASATTSTDSAPMETEELSKRADGIINDHVLGAIALGAIPVPLVDLAGLTVVQASMIQSLSELHGMECTLGEARKWMIAFAGGSTSVLLGMRLARSMLKLVPVVGSILGGLSASASGGAVTYALGQLFRTHCQQGGNAERGPSQEREVPVSERDRKVGPCF